MIKLSGYGADYPQGMDQRARVSAGIDDREECAECMDNDTDQQDCPHDNEDGHDFDDYARDYPACV